MPHTTITASKRNRRLILSICILLLFTAAFLWFPRPSFLQTEQERFASFSRTVFRDELAGNTLSMHYTIADPDKWNLKDVPVSLGSLHPDAIRNSFAALENYRSALLRFDYSRLSDSQKRTYEVFLNHLETELSAAPFFLYEEPLSPTLGIQAQIPILLAEYDFRTKRDIEDYLTLLSLLPSYFDSILAFEQEKSANGLFMSSDSVAEVIQQCREFIQDPENNYLLTLFHEKIDAIRNLTADEKIAFKSRNHSMVQAYVIPAYESLIEGLNQIKNTGVNEKGLSSYPQGKSYYEYLVKRKTGDYRSIAVIEEAMKDQMIADYKAIQTSVQKTENASDTASASGASASAVLPALSDPSAVLNDLRAKIAADFPLLPDVSCEIRYVHDSLQEYLSPAFYLTPALDDYTNNTIYINPADSSSDLERYTTLAHEGYPGHLYQSVYYCSQNPDPLRSLLDTGGYTEGWATYAEMYAFSLWKSNPELADLSQHNRAFTLGLASLLDIGIHYHGYSLDDVTDFLSKLGFEPGTAKSLYRSILQSPANYLQYYVGYLNFCSLRDEMQELMQENFSLKEFHRLVLNAGPAPFALLRKYVIEDATCISPQLQLYSTK